VPHPLDLIRFVLTFVRPDIQNVPCPHSNFEQAAKRARTEVEEGGEEEEEPTPNLCRTAGTPCEFVCASLSSSLSSFRY